jgi:hypothetical protein
VEGPRVVLRRDRRGQSPDRTGGLAYHDPAPDFEAIRHAVAFYPGLMDECTLDGELVEPQEGGFYGGWITSEVVGPFKRGPGTLGR